MTPVKYCSIDGVLEQSKDKNGKPRLSRGLVRGLVVTGQIASVGIGRKILILEEEVERLLSEGIILIASNRN